MANQLNAKQRKALTICVGVSVASFAVKWIYTEAQQAALLQKQAVTRAAQQKANNNAPGRDSTKPPARPAPPRRPPLTVVTSLGNLEGMWMGQRLLNASGMCTLRLEMRPVPEVPQDYKGYARLNCLPPAGLVSLRGGRVLPKQQRDNLNPVAMVLTGVPEDGALHFTLDKTVVAPNDDCETTEFVVTPFGTNQVALEWREGKCRGMQLILNKNGR
jgi:hypothetical protein